jgi:hypothetical protein
MSSHSHTGRLSVLTVLVILISSISVSALAAGDMPPLRRTPPALPLSISVGAYRGQVVHTPHWIHSQSTTADSAPPPDPSLDTLILPLSAGLSMISIPLETPSQTLSDLLPNLPDGSRVWTWDVGEQQFVEGFDRTLPLGQGALLYLPAPSIITVTGTAAASDEVPVELTQGWNLIGVPYNLELVRSQQSVTVDYIDTPFNDAVAAGAVDDNVFSLDVNGYQRVGPDDSFEPMHAYWLYATSQSLLKMEPTLLSAGAGFSPAFWIAEKIGGAAVTWGVGQLLTSLEPAQPDPFDVVNAKLDSINNQIGDIRSTQVAMLAAVNLNRQELGDATARILTAVQNGRVLDVENKLTSYYDDTTAGRSLGYFQQQAGKHQSVSQQELTDFAFDVLYTYDFPSIYNQIYTAITGGTDGGVLDSYGDFVANASSPGTLSKRYELMQNYFNYLIGLQAKCAVLIVNAYNQLAAVPPYKGKPQPAANEGERWRLDNYNKKILPELAQYRTVVESILGRRMQLTRDARPLVVPVELRQMVWNADLVIMNIAGEPSGLRVHMLTNPGTITNTYLTLLTQYPGNTTDGRFNNIGCYSGSNPRCPADTVWTTLTGPGPYDDWKLNVFGGAPATMRQFNITTDWQLGRFILPLTASDFAGQSALNVSLSLQALPYIWKDQTETATVSSVDPLGRPSQSGKAFGSIIVLNRPMANMMLDGSCVVPYDVTAGLSRFTKPSGDSRNRMGFTCDRLDISGCYGTNGNYGVDCTASEIAIPFAYVGTAPAQIEILAHSDTWVDGPCVVSDTSSLSLWGPSQALGSQRNTLSGLVNLVPQTNYTFLMTNIAVVLPKARGCGTHVKFKDAFIFGR